MRGLTNIKVHKAKSNELPIRQETDLKQTYTRKGFEMFQSYLTTRNHIQRMLIITIMYFKIVSLKR